MIRASATQYFKRFIRREIAQQRYFTYGGDDDDDYAPEFAPASGAEMMHQQLPAVLTPFESSVVTVGKGTGFMFRMPTSTRTLGIDAGDLVVATSTKLLKSATDVHQKITGQKVKISKVWTQRHATLEETPITGGTKFADEGVSVFKVQNRSDFSSFVTPYIAGISRSVSIEQFTTAPVVIHPDSKNLVAQTSVLGSPYPKPSLSDFGPLDWNDSFLGSPVFQFLGHDTASSFNPHATNKQSHRAVAIITGYDSSVPHNPLVTIGSISLLMDTPLAVVKSGPTGNFVTYFEQGSRTHFGA